MPKVTIKSLQAKIRDLEAEITMLRDGPSFDPPGLEAQLKHISESLHRANDVIASQDGEIGRLTHLNDRMFRIIDKMITKEEPNAQLGQPSE